MPEVNIRGVPVTFPFKPYPNQIVYMERVIQGLSEGKNCLLEVPLIEPDLFDRCSVLIFSLFSCSTQSPTGTGKTLCLLCATLAWRQHKYPSAASTAEAAFSARNASLVPGQQGGPGDDRKSPVPAAAAAGQGQGGLPPPQWGGSAGAPQIIYTSRTHTQLSQVLKEL